ncbi:hypothetical protein N8616_03135, partial [Verrucomicrobia bacterium]|nr:hypothetical protein [Verrucomicrobiota bacterium]
MVKCNDIFNARMVFVWKTVQSVISILFLIGMASAVHGQIELVIPEALSIKEGQAGDQTLSIQVSLGKRLPTNRVIEISTRPLTATPENDYLSFSNQLLFAAGKKTPGLPIPSTSTDPLTQEVRIPHGFGIEMLADVNHPAPLALANQISGFTDGLYVGQLVNKNSTRQDSISYISLDGTELEIVTKLLPETDPAGLVFASPYSEFEQGMYISANNRDGGRPGALGGAVQYLDASHNVIDFTAVGLPSGPGEPSEILFGQYGWAKDLLILANSVGSPGDLLSVRRDGGMDILLNDGQDESSTEGLAIRSMAMATEGSPFRDWLYLGEFGRKCLCIQRWHPDRGLETWINEIQGAPHGMIFGRGGVFGNDLYVAIDRGDEGQVIRITPDGSISEFITGLQGFLYGSGKNVMEFDHEGNVLYLSDYYGHRVYRIGAAESTLALRIEGDPLPEPDETLIVSFSEINGTVIGETLITILNDDGELPGP